MPADRAKTIAFKFGGHKYVFGAGAFNYTAIPDRQDWQYSSGRHNFNTRWIDVTFQVSIGYLGQQRNDGQAYRLQDGSQIAAAPSVGITDVLEALKGANVNPVRYWPKLEDNAGMVWTAHYKVLPAHDKLPVMQAERGGRYDMDVPLKLQVATPLTSYPPWMNR